MRIFLAPMEGVVDHHMRALFAKLGGVDIAVTEFVRVSQGRLPDKVLHRLCPEMQNPISIPVRVQLLGSEPERLAEHAARAAELGAIGIDLNFGCPAKTVNKSRGGACLLQEPNLLNAIACAVRGAVPSRLPVTAKIRLGFNAREGYIDNACALADGGINELFVHARSKVDGYKPPAYWPLIAKIQEVLTIPVIANGEIWTLQDAKQCLAESQCSDLMIGRGLLARPDLALMIKRHLAEAPASTEDGNSDKGSLHEKNSANAYMPWEEVLPLVWDYHRATIKAYGQKYTGNRLKQWLMYLKLTYPQAHQLFERVKRLRDEGELEKAYAEHVNNLSGLPHHLTVPNLTQDRDDAGELAKGKAPNHLGAA